ncbi:MAG: YybH family protein [Pyrinomonadaceae bacterium]
MMDRIFLVLLTIVAAVSLSSGQTKASKTSSTGLRSAIEAANQRFVEALGKGDAAKIADMYAEGARVLPPNGPMVQGRQRIQEFWQGFINTGAKLALRTSDVEAQGNVLYEVGTYELISPDNKRDTGKYVVVWKRQKGGWKLAIDTWNSDMPASGN